MLLWNISTVLNIANFPNLHIVIQQKLKKQYC